MVGPILYISYTSDLLAEDERDDLYEIQMDHLSDNLDWLAGIGILHIGCI